MRFIEHDLGNDQEKETPKKGKSKEEPRVLAGSKDYDYSTLGKGSPMKGGNSWS